MAMYDRKGYKNPRMPRTGEVLSPGQQASAAPPRAGGLMQMAAQARARQPKTGAPPIPETKPVRPTPPRRAQPSLPQAASVAGAPPPQKVPGVMPQHTMVDAGQEALDWRRKAAAQLLAPSQGQDSQAMGAGDAGPGMKQLPAPQPGTGLAPQYAGGVDAVGAPVGDVEGLPDFYQYDAAAMEPQPEGAGAGAGGAQIPGTEILGDDDLVDDPTKGPGYVAGAETDMGDPDPNLEKDLEPSDDAIPDPSDTGYHASTEIAPEDDPDAEKGADPGAPDFGTVVESQLMDYLNQATGIPEEELQGQIAQLQMASTDQMAKFAQQMAARGVGASGLVGQGMGQIASQTVAAIANVRFENAKLALDERLNKMKAYMGMYGQVLSEENRMAIFEQMNQWDKEKHNYQVDQDRIQSEWNEVANLPVLLSAENGWGDGDALAWAFKHITEGTLSTAEVMANIHNQDGTLVLKDPNLGMGTGESGESGEGAPSGYGPDGKPLITEGTWKEKFDAAAEGAYEYAEKWFSMQGQEMPYDMKSYQSGNNTNNAWAQQQGYQSWEHFVQSFIG